MNWKNDCDLINDLVNMGIFKERALTKKEFDELSELNKNSNSLIYMNGKCENIYKHGEYDSNENDDNSWYKEVNTNGMDIDDIRLRVELNKAKNIRSIKGMVTFFVVLTIVSLILMVMQIL